jgi:hsp70-interacting protein
MIELIDNANNLVALKMWEPLLELLKDKEDGIVAHVCWIIGTAVQNNLTAQAAVRILSLRDIEQLYSC